MQPLLSTLLIPTLFSAHEPKPLQTVQKKSGIKSRLLLYIYENFACQFLSIFILLISMFYNIIIFIHLKCV